MGILLWIAAEIIILYHKGRQDTSLPPFLLDSLIFPSCGHSASDVPLSLIFIQDPLHLEVEGMVEGGQAFG